MNFEFTEEQLMIKQAAKDFAQSELLDGVIERDNNALFPKEQLKKLGKLGFLGMMTSPNYDGSGMDTISYVLAIEEISKIDASVSVVMSVQNSLVCYVLEHYGNNEQKQKYLKPLAKGEIIGAFALSEPEAGSDATHQKTTAIDKGDYYLLNGTKNWITSGKNASVYIVFAQTDVSKRHKGINALIIEKGMQGFEVGAKEDKMGMRSSDTTSLMFNDVKVSKENRLSVEGEGFHIAMQALNGGRIGIAAQALGIAQGALDRALLYAKERKAFGKLLIDHQSVAFKLSDMEALIESARLLILKAAWLKDNKKDFTHASAIAKLVAAEMAMKVTTEAVQIHGGYGYVKEYHVERLMREAKLTQIYEGTSEIQKIVISRGLLKR